MILVTGPTGSGRRCRSYTCLNILNQPGVNISTVEDPAEMNLPGMQPGKRAMTRPGLTFAAALKSFLRQDPDVIMVGEIRDLETADIAIKAAQTGHLVLSTLHTNDAPRTLTRLLEHGRGTVQHRVQRVVDHGAAAGTAAVRKLQGSLPTIRPIRILKAGFRRPISGWQLEAVSRSGLLGLQQRLQGPSWHVPGDADHRDHPAHHPGRKDWRWTSPIRPPRKACATCGQFGLGQGAVAA